MNGTFTEERVTYTLQTDGKLVVVENVPARVCLETGEQFFSPDTVEHLTRLIRSRTEPNRMLQTPVYEYV